MRLGVFVPLLSLSLPLLSLSSSCLCLPLCLSVCLHNVSLCLSISLLSHGPSIHLSPFSRPRPASTVLHESSSRRQSRHLASFLTNFTKAKEKVKAEGYPGSRVSSLTACSHRSRCQHTEFVGREVGLDIGARVLLDPAAHGRASVSKGALCSQRFPSAHDAANASPPTYLAEEEV